MDHAPRLLLRHALATIAYRASKVVSAFTGGPAHGPAEAGHYVQVKIAVALVEVEE